MFYRIYLAVLALLAWFALAAQLYIIIRYRSSSIGATVVQYFSYYTILTNILVAWVCSRLFLKRQDTSSQKRTLTAILVYIMTVGLTYNIMLRPLWKPQGLQLMADNLLHTFIPLLYLLFWMLYVMKHRLEWKDILPWLLYPLVYLIYIMIRGAVSGVYPYPFIDVSRLGYLSAILNSVGVTVVILFFAVISVAITRRAGVTSAQSV